MIKTEIHRSPEQEQEKSSSGDEAEISTEAKNTKKKLEKLLN